MSRKCNDQRLDAIRATIESHPNKKPGTIASILGIDNKSVMRALPQLETRGDLLQEDANGRLSLFKSKSKR